MYKNFFSRWCDQLWLYATYFLGAVMLYVLIWNWNDWVISQKLACMLAIAVPIHIFEENSFPGGFFFMNNLSRNKNGDPMVGPQNRCTNMVTNLGATIVMIIVTFNATKIEASVMSLIIFFALGELFHHTTGGIQMLNRYREKGKKTIYGPGTASCWLVLNPLAVVALHWLVTNGATLTQILGGIGIFLCIAIFLILIPFAISMRVKSQEFAFRDRGYFDKYEN